MGQDQGRKQGLLQARGALSEMGSKSGEQCNTPTPAPTPAPTHNYREKQGKGEEERRWEDTY